MTEENHLPPVSLFGPDLVVSLITEQEFVLIDGFQPAGLPAGCGPTQTRSDNNVVATGTDGRTDIGHLFESGPFSNHSMGSDVATRPHRAPVALYIVGLFKNV